MKLTIVEKNLLSWTAMHIDFVMCNKTSATTETSFLSIAGTKNHDFSRSVHNYTHFGQFYHLAAVESFMSRIGTTKHWQNAASNNSKLSVILVSSIIKYHQLIKKVFFKTGVSGSNV